MIREKETMLFNSNCKTWLRKIAIIIILLTVNVQLQAQVNSYTFSQSAGSYAPLTAARTILFTATAGASSDPGLGGDRVFTLPDSTIPFDFGFDGLIYRGLFISTNGFITFGATAPATNNYTPISTSNAYTGAISAMGVNLSANTNAANLGEISYQVLGSSPNRTFTIQFSKFRRNSSSSTFTEDYNFQIQLNEAGGILARQTIKIVYGTCLTTNTNTGVVHQVGLRGPSNSFPNNVNNRMNSTAWTNSIPGTANNSYMRLTTTIPIVSGQTYTWTPQTGEFCTDNAMLIPVLADSLTAVNSAGTLLVTGYTKDGPLAKCSDYTGNSAGRDRWAKFIAPATGSRLIVLTTQGTITDWVMEIWSDCPGTGIAEHCSDDVNNQMPESQMCNYIAGHTYYLRFWPYYADSTGNFTLKIYQSPDPCPIPPGNNVCSAAEVLPISTAGNCPFLSVSGSTVESTNGADGQPSCHLTDTVEDVWYTFNSGVNCNLTLTMFVNFGSVNASLYNACNGTELQCFPSVIGSNLLTGLTANTNYLLRIWSNPAATSDFGICLAQTAIPTCISSPTAPAYGEVGVTDCGTTLRWPAKSGACSYDVYLNTGTVATTLVDSNISITSYNTGPLLSSQNYAWKIVPRNSTGKAAVCSSFTFTTGATNDGDACTIDACNSVTGTITHTFSQPPAPAVSVTNNCGNTVLTASGYTGSLLWSSGETTASITVFSAVTRTVTQKINGCTSPAGSGSANPLIVPGPPAVAVSNNCGNSVLTASGFTGTLLWSTGASSTAITVFASNIYTVTVTAANGCVSSPGAGNATPTTIPSTPSVSVTNNCSNSTLTAGNYSGTLLWSTGAVTSSINVTMAGTYSVTQSSNGCTSLPGTGTSAPITPPLAPSVSVTNNCGTSVLTASGYTGTLAWSTGATTPSITVGAGTFTATVTAANGCTSSASGTAVPLLPPAQPSISVSNNCGTSVLTASGYSGTLLWNTGATSTSITVPAGTYTVTVTSSTNGCTSSRSGTAAPLAVPSAPNISVSDNCGTSVLTASGYTGTLSWSTGATTPSITVSAGTYSVTLTASNGCTSMNTKTASPKTIPTAPTIIVNDICNSTIFSATDYTGAISWSNGATTATITTSINNSIRTVYQTINGCISLASPGSTGTAHPKPIPTQPSVTVVDNCGSSVLTAGNYTGTLLWNNGANTPSITVSVVMAYTVTQTAANGCTSVPSQPKTPAPKAVPNSPIVTVVDNCSSSSTLTVTNYTTGLSWSTGASSVSINVNTAGTYSVTVTAANGCPSIPGTGVAAPKQNPATPGVIVIDNCGSSVLTATGITGTLLWSTGATTTSITVSTIGAFTITQTGANGCTSGVGSGNANPKLIPGMPTIGVTNNCSNSILSASAYTGTLLWSTGSSAPSITVALPGTYTVTQTTANGCTSSVGSAVAAPVTPQLEVLVNNNCGNTKLTVTNNTGSILWSTGATTPSITVTTPGTYTVTQSASTCTSIPASNTIIIYAPINNINLQLKVFIEGFYLPGGTMTPVLDPIGQPNICDSIRIEIHEAFSPYDMVYSFDGLLDIYGNVVNAQFSSVACGNYYLIVKSRNLVETWIKEPFIIGNPNTIYDLTR